MRGAVGEFILRIITSFRGINTVPTGPDAWRSRKIYSVNNH